MDHDLYNRPGIDPTALIHPSVIIGPNVTIGPYCVIGYPAENIDTFPTDEGRVTIHSGAILTGFVTVDSGTKGSTEIGPDCFIMKHCHIGHDVLLGQEVRIAPGAKVGGHCVIGKRAYIGMNATIINRATVGEYCMVGAGAVVVKKHQAHSKRIFVGNPAKDAGYNEAGLNYWMKRYPDDVTIQIPKKLRHIPSGAALVKSMNTSRNDIDKRNNMDNKL